MTDIENSIRKQMAFQKWTTVIVVTMFIGFVSTLVYWTLEPDPLSVERLPEDTAWSDCTERQFSFHRTVRSSKTVDIFVQERWHDLDGMMDYGNTEGELVIPKPIHYPLGEDFSKAMQFRKAVPKVLPIGRYEYRPWATYQVNPIKTITRMLPVQHVHVHCEYDKDKHGVMD